MSEPQEIVVVGAGIVGVSTALWLVRAGQQVTLIDRGLPGQGTSFGNAGLLARCAVNPVSAPGLLWNAPRYLLNPDFPLFLRWSYLPRLTPWLLRFLRNANSADSARIADGIAQITADSVEQHKALVKGSDAEGYLIEGDYAFAYADRAAFDMDSHTWELKGEAGFVPEMIEGGAVHDYEPALGPDINCLAVLKDHGHISDPGRYVTAIADQFQKEGGTLLRAGVRDFEMAEGRVTSVITGQGAIDCDRAVICTGAWSKTLARKLGIKVPLETERGYHLMLKSPSAMPRVPIMVAASKFAVTPMAEGLRCAGIVELGGLKAGPSKAPLELLRTHFRRVFPDIEWESEEEWLGFRPTLPDSMPMIGEVGQTGVYAGFGHQHIGLTAGPKTGRLLADMITGRPSNRDLSVFDPARF